MNYIESTLARLPSIALDELVEAAALLHRCDRKYVVGQAQLQYLARALPRDAHVLRINEGCRFQYESTYFDTPDHQSYLATAHRRRHRFKVRTRTYTDSLSTFLEVKLPDARRRTLKIRLPYGFTDRDRMTPAGREFVRAHIAKSGLDTAFVDELQSTVHTAFVRSTLFVPSAGCRITIDSDLVVSQVSGTQRKVPGLIVVETKAANGDRGVDQLLWRMGVRPLSISKFGIGSALLDPALPANKWNRTMSRHFTSCCLPGEA